MANDHQRLSMPDGALHNWDELGLLGLTGTRRDQLDQSSYARHANARQVKLIGVCS